MRKTENYVILIFFLVKIVFGLIIIKTSAELGSPEIFNFFSQFFIAFSLLNLVATAGLQNGMVREIAHASGDRDVETKVVSTAMIVVLGVGSIIIAAAALFANPISHLLADNGRYSWLVPVIAAFAALAGLGQMLCAHLTGIGKNVQAMVLQAICLILGGGACAAMLWRGDALSALLSYAAGVALLPALVLATSPASRDAFLVRPQHDRAMLHRLGRFSLSFIVTASAMPLTLFALRAVYRDHAGDNMLSYWIAANRVSDVFTQLLGIYMAQSYLRTISSVKTVESARRSVVTALTQTVFIMSAGVIIFALAPSFWIESFLGPAFAGAIGLIAVYLLGDIVRALPSVALYSALGVSRTDIYAVLEILNAVVFATIALLLFRWNVPVAPGLAYVLSNFIVGLSGYLLIRKAFKKHYAGGPHRDS